MKLDTNSLAHTKWECKYHIVFAMVFSITHCCVNFIKASCYSIYPFPSVLESLDMKGMKLLQQHFVKHKI